MTTNFAITVFNGKVIEAVYVRELDVNSCFDLGDSCGIIDFVSYFLDVCPSSLVLHEHSKFARYAVINYEDSFSIKEIIVTWENFQ